MDSKRLELEYCSVCDEPTGCAGRADDSHYNEDGEGPFCWGCWCKDENPRLHEQVDQLQAELALERTEHSKKGRWINHWKREAKKFEAKLAEANEGRCKALDRDGEGLQCSHSLPCPYHPDEADLLVQIAKLQAELAELKKPCKWIKREDSDKRDTGCGTDTYLTAESVPFCPYCGHPIEEVK